MGKFFYQYRNQEGEFAATVNRLEKILPTTPSLGYCKSDRNQLLWINNSKGLFVSDFSLTTGFPAREVRDTFYSFKLTVTENTISLTSDLVASRTVWYYLDEDTFIASSSQRMIIAALQRFDINTQAIVWMLSTGSLGPGHSWDRHI